MIIVKLYYMHGGRNVMLNNKINKRMLILAAVIFVQCIYITLMFGINKQGFHSDELWNYGFANSTAGTHIFKEDI